MGTYNTECLCACCSETQCQKAPFIEHQDSGMIELIRFYFMSKVPTFGKVIFFSFLPFFSDFNGFDHVSLQKLIDDMIMFFFVK